jgi:nucleoside-diphosphate-sugar epimerase
LKDRNKIRLLITGGNGYIAKAITERIHKKYAVMSLVRNTADGSFLEKFEDVELIRFSHFNDISDIVQRLRPNIILHAACCYGRNNESFAEIYKANVLFGIELLNAIKVADLECTFINFGTHLHKNVNLYSFSKHSFQEILFSKVFLNESVRVLNINLQNTYGPFDTDRKFPTFILRSCGKNVPEINLTSGVQRRDFIYIDDVVEAFDVLLRNVNKLQSGKLDLGTGTLVSIKNFALTAKKLTKSTSSLNFGSLDQRQDDIADPAVNIDTLLNFGWRPKVSIEEGIKKVLDQECLV